VADSVLCGGGNDAVKVELTYLRGLFQGDSLSPFLYCLSIAPLSMALRGAGGTGWLITMNDAIFFVRHRY